MERERERPKAGRTEGASKRKEDIRRGGLVCWAWAWFSRGRCSLLVLWLSARRVSFVSCVCVSACLPCTLGGTCGGLLPSAVVFRPAWLSTSLEKSPARPRSIDRPPRNWRFGGMTETCVRMYESHFARPVGVLP